MEWYYLAKDKEGEGAGGLLAGRAAVLPALITPGGCATIFPALERAGAMPGWIGSFRIPAARGECCGCFPYAGASLLFGSIPSS